MDEFSERTKELIDWVAKIRDEERERERERIIEFVKTFKHHRWPSTWREKLIQFIECKPEGE